MNLYVCSDVVPRENNCISSLLDANRFEFHDGIGGAHHVMILNRRWLERRPQT